MQHRDDPAPTTAPQDVDVIVVGAGFAGLYLIHDLRRRGFSVRAFEAGSGVGGTWFWNRYPGARCDVESIDYSFSFSEELQQEWVWSERYATQPEILRYLDHVADRFDLRRDIAFETRITSAHFDEDDARWTVTTDRGERHRARWCVMATGTLSSVNRPDFDGIDEFRGEWHHTARWPEGGVDFGGRRVGVLGTGSTGIQAIPVIAAQAEHTVVFQRTPNFSIPARNRPLTAEELEGVKATYADRRARARVAPSGVPSDRTPTPGADATPEERLAAYEAGWAVGGAPGLLRSYSDLLLDEEVNDSIADFARGKIRSMVDDPATAQALVPHGYPFGGKRLCVDTDYYPTYNRDDVELVDLQRSPIARLVPEGVQLEDGTVHEIDVLVLATGFDAITGAVRAIDIRGRDGRGLSDAWTDGPEALLGLAAPGFPNLFLVNGPGSPAVLGNAVTFIEHHVDWIGDALSTLRDDAVATIEATPEATHEWSDHVDEVAHRTLYPKAPSWFVGANVPGKPRRFLPYAGGLDRYRAICQEVADEGFRGFRLERAADRGAATAGSASS